MTRQLLQPADVVAIGGEWASRTNLAGEYDVLYLLLFSIAK
jgi:hypothetical protein